MGFKTQFRFLAICDCWRDVGRRWNFELVERSGGTSTRGASSARSASARGVAEPGVPAPGPGGLRTEGLGNRQFSPFPDRVRIRADRQMGGRATDHRDQALAGRRDRRLRMRGGRATETACVTTIGEILDTSIEAGDQFLRSEDLFRLATVDISRPLPPGVVGYIPPPPPGYVVGYFDGYVVVYDPISFTVLSVMDLLD